jgi:hypothetical protein
LSWVTVRFRIGVQAPETQLARLGEPLFREVVSRSQAERQIARGENQDLAWSPGRGYYTKICLVGFKVLSGALTDLLAQGWLGDQTSKYRRQ